MNGEGSASASASGLDDHSRAIVHVDIDCFYAQVEARRNPELRDKPFGVRQKNIIVTSNYAARAFGIRKCMPVAEGLRLCPGLVLVDGEDLRPYRQASADVFALLRKFDCPVEKSGMDENYVDVTSLVKDADETGPEPTLHGDLYEEGGEERCLCGCERRLRAASAVAAEIRRRIREELDLTSSAGIAHNKLLAKLAGARRKPDAQTTVLPGSSRSFMSRLGGVGEIPGIGAKTAAVLGSIGLATVSDLQNCDGRVLDDTFSADVSLKLRRLGLGADSSEVKTSGRPASIGLEDGFGTVSVESEARAKFEALLTRLLALLEDDGRRPTGLRVTVRRRTGRRPIAHRETRQCGVSPSLFRFRDGALELADSARERLIALAMRLFRKSVDLSKPFHVTLLGLAFTKFQETVEGRGSIANYLLKDLSVQSVISLRSDADSGCSPMECEASTDSAASERSESDAEPSPKKVRKAFAGVRRRLRRASPAPSPSKLRVADLHLNACDAVSLLRLSPKEIDSDSGRSGSPDWSGMPPDVDVEVFEALPSDIREDLRMSWRRSVPNGDARRDPSAPKGKGGNAITRYFLPNDR